MFEPTRAAGLSRLDAFAEKAGRDYAAQRNYDRPGHPDVSRLSPYIRHRMITEAEVLAATLEHHSRSAAQKFIQEVYWRTYWKGWLEMRPAVWTLYRTDLQAAWNRVQIEEGLRRDWEDACRGETGIEVFDHWARELVDTGYLHNHARMWFASIWIFTLRLPWELGADFFLRHLLDGDPASNTLGWRWVGGLQTRGKTYLARPGNIARYTEGRFKPTGLAPAAPPLDGPPHPARLDPPLTDPVDPTAPTGFLLTEEDMTPDWILDDHDIAPRASGFRLSAHARSPLEVSEHVTDFTERAMADAAQRLAPQLGALAPVGDLARWAEAEGLSQIVTSYAPQGPARDWLTGQMEPLRQAGVTLAMVVRPYDLAAWPHATAGFFKFKEKIPTLLGQAAGLTVAK